MPKYKILHMIDGLGYGGAEKWIYNIVKYCYLQKYPIENDILCTGGMVRDLDGQIKEYKAKIYYVKYSTKKLLEFRKMVLPILIQGQYTMIWNHQDYFAGYQFLALGGYLPEIRMAYLHNPINQTWFYRKDFVRNISYYLGKYLTAFISTHLSGTSNAVMDVYGYDHWPHKKIRINPIHCAFDVNEFRFNSDSRRDIRNNLKISNQDMVILFVGRLSLEHDNPFPNQKNPGFAFDLAKTITSMNGKYKFLFVGDKGHVGNQMQLEVETLELSKNIFFLGAQWEVTNYYMAADLLIFPSLYEGLGMVAVEAQCMNLPVIMTDQVPVEAVVDPTFVKRLPLDRSIWTEAILSHTIAERSESINPYVLASDFNIANSILNIQEFIQTNT